MSDKANNLIRELAKSARPGVPDSQLADVLLDAFADFYDEEDPDAQTAVMTLARLTLQRLQWSGSR